MQYFIFLKGEEVKKQRQDSLNCDYNSFCIKLDLLRSFIIMESIYIGFSFNNFFSCSLQ